MGNLYDAMDKILAAEESVNAFLNVLDTFSRCSGEDIEKTALSLIKITQSVLKDVSENQHEAIGIIDNFLANNSGQRPKEKKTEY